MTLLKLKSSITEVASIVIWRSMKMALPLECRKGVEGMAYRSLETLYLVIMVQSLTVAQITGNLDQWERLQLYAYRQDNAQGT